MDVTDEDICPCDTGRSFDQCCGPLLTSERLAGTAVELMRSRYTAYVYGNREHLWRTWHPTTRPVEVTLDPDTTWISLHINEIEAGTESDSQGVVDFTATYAGGRLHERSRFERRGGRWFYLDGQVS